MKILKSPILLLLCSIALLVYLARWTDISLPSWISLYLNDILCMPIILSLSLAIVRIIKKEPFVYAPTPAIIGLAFFYTVYFEWYLPKINERYTGDLIDVGLYFIGATLFFLFQKRLF